MSLNNYFYLIYKYLKIIYNLLFDFYNKNIIRDFEEKMNSQKNHIKIHLFIFNLKIKIYYRKLCIIQIYYHKNYFVERYFILFLIFLVEVL